ncbi:MAG: hypothetical protein GF347_05070 [Candidatus Moranbacteria bacterium]|nr:hypothetical protein [Candidatus Moranbacteria bacterium]
MYFIIYLLVPLIGILGIIGIIFFIRRLKKKNSGENFNKEDSLSQAFALLSLCFFGVTLAVFNRDLGQAISWQTILLISGIVGMIISYYLKFVSTLAPSLIGLTVWWSFKADEWISDKNIKGTSLIAALVFIALIAYLMSRYHEKEFKWRRFRKIYSALGLSTITVVLFIFSMDEGLKIFENVTNGDPFIYSWQISLSLLIFLTSLVGLATYDLIHRLIIKSEYLVILGLGGLFLIISLLPEQNLFDGGALNAIGFLAAIFFNLMVFLQLLAFILLGYLKRKSWFINLGTFLLFLFIFIKYFDWFFDFIDKSIFFISAGLLLFLVGYFMEKARRRMIEKIKPQPQPQQIIQ